MNVAKGVVWVLEYLEKEKVRQCRTCLQDVVGRHPRCRGVTTRHTTSRNLAFFIRPPSHGTTRPDPPERRHKGANRKLAARACTRHTGGHNLAYFIRPPRHDPTRTRFLGRPHATRPDRTRFPARRYASHSASKSRPVSISVPQ